MSTSRARPISWLERRLQKQFAAAAKRNLIRVSTKRAPCAFCGRRTAKGLFILARNTCLNVCGPCVRELHLVVP